MKPSSVFNRSINYLVNASKTNKSSINKPSIQLVRVTNSTQNLTSARKDILWPLLQTAHNLASQNQFAADQHLRAPVATSPIYETPSSATLGTPEIYNTPRPATLATPEIYDTPRPASLATSEIYDIPREQAMPILQAISGYSSILANNNLVETGPQAPPPPSLESLAEAKINANAKANAESIYLAPDDENFHLSISDEPIYQNVPNQTPDASLDNEPIYAEVLNEPIYETILDEPIYQNVPNQTSDASLDIEPIYATIPDQPAESPLNAEPIYDEPFEPYTQNASSESLDSMIEKGLIKSTLSRALQKNTTENSEQEKTPSSAKSIILPSGNNTESDS